MSAEFAEYCMTCASFGPVNFECGHPDDHLPVANSYQDANGEPLSIHSRSTEDTK